ncbi:MAG TPA: acetate--CoA ligase family protein, partial [Candidatus Dormibacteraeota bacterium]
FGAVMVSQLLDGGFDGRVHLVNPRYGEIAGHRCVASLRELDEAPDLVVLGISNAAVEEQLRLAAEIGARAAVIFSSCYEAPQPHRPALTERLARIARERGMAVCGGNGMGFLNVERRLRATGYTQSLTLAPGGVAFVSHSGSAFSAMLRNRRGIRFNLAVSSGQELVTTMADYLDYAIDLPSTRVVAVLMETVRNPSLLVTALERAAEHDIPVVALKVGRSALAQSMVAAHSGALAGEDGAYEALFDRFGVLRVEGLDEMCDTLELLCAGRRAGPGGLATVHDSGGERAHLADVADAAGVPLARIDPVTTARLAEVLEPGLEATNPLDAWGTSESSEAVFSASLRALHDDPDTAALAFCVDLTPDEVNDAYPALARDAFRAGGKPFAMLCNQRSAIDPAKSRWLRRAGIPVLEGTITGVRAFAHLFAYRDFQLRPRAAAATGGSPERAARWRKRLGADTLREAEALELLSDYGVTTVACRQAESVAGALAAAVSIGWPVALKTAAPGVLHKSDAGGVRLALDDEAGLRAAYADIAARLGPRVVVAAMAPAGVELALGIVRDAQFGPLVVVAAGGLLVEAIADRRVVMPPVDRAQARALVDRLAVRRLLDGYRGQPAADLDAVADAVVSLAELAIELGESLDALDINPLIAGPDGCLAVDALVIAPRSALT